MTSDADGYVYTCTLWHTDREMIVWISEDKPKRERYIEESWRTIQCRTKARWSVACEAPIMTQGHRPA